MEITIVEGDIVEQHVDAVVNAANSGLMGGGGVDGAILRAGGPVQLAARRELVDRIGSLPTGQAAWTDAGDDAGALGDPRRRSGALADRGPHASCWRRATARRSRRRRARRHARSPSRPCRPASTAGRSTTPPTSPCAPLRRHRPTSTTCASCCSATRRWRSSSGRTHEPARDATAGADRARRRRGVLRRSRRDDLDALHAAIEESRDHLRPFMPWADQTRADTARSSPRRSTSGPRAPIRLRHRRRRRRRRARRCGLHAGSAPTPSRSATGCGHGATGRGIVTAAARALTDAAFDARRASNGSRSTATRRTCAAPPCPAALGYRLDRIEADHVSAPGDLGRSMIWVKRRSSAAATASRVRRSAHDANASSA